LEAEGFEDGRAFRECSSKIEDNMLDSCVEKDRNRIGIFLKEACSGVVNKTWGVIRNVSSTHG